MPSTSKVAAIRGNSADQKEKQKKTHHKAIKATTSSGRRDTAALSEFGDDDERFEAAVGNSLDPAMKKNRGIKKESKKSRMSKAVKRQGQSMRHMAEVIKRSLRSKLLRFTFIFEREKLCHCSTIWYG